MNDFRKEIRDTPLRQSLFNWYEFEPEASLLEIRADGGVLTELFCRRCRQVTAVAASEEAYRALCQQFPDQSGLTICQRSQWETVSTRTYDYIVAVGELEYVNDPKRQIREWMGMLREGGILLIVVENRFGLKYFCGARDPHTGLPYDSINGYLSGEREKGTSFSRKELASAVSAAGVPHYQFFYPVPDSRMPQMIFSDHYRNGINTAERLVDYNYEDPSMLGIEHRIFCEMIEEGALPFLSNSFLLELTDTGKLSDIRYAVTTTDRGPLRGTVTTIRQSDTVKKRPLWPEGEANLRQLDAYTRELKQRGIPILPVKLERDSFGLALDMPYVREEGLSQVVRRMIKEDPERFLSIFDEIYQFILAASEAVPHKVGEDTVLKRAYLDLAPCNCFYNREKGSLLFYDQEFAMENCPAGFAMFRTLKYAYASAREMEQYIPLSRMYERYGIRSELLPGYEAREAEFISGIRGLEQYQSIINWATPDYQTVLRRMEQSAGRIRQEEGTEKKPYGIGYVPGVFDLFHTGHLKLLERCKARCEYLIVGVLTDELVKFYKGRKPVISFENRVQVMEALKVTDQVIAVDFSNTDKLDAWDQLHYDCHFSGDDHRNHWKEVWEELKRRGSNMEFFSYTEGISSTQIREKIEKESVCI